MEKLPVIFRAHKGDGEVTAIFPTLPATYDGDCLTGYAFVGQHHAVHPDWVRQKTRPATPAEYAGLLDELRATYEAAPDAVELVPCKRMTPKHRAAFAAAVKGAR